MTCHEFLEWTDSLNAQDWHDMQPDVFRDMTRCVALAYMMQSTPTTQNIFGRVHGRATSDIQAAQKERRQLQERIRPR